MRIGAGSDVRDDGPLLRFFLARRKCRPLKRNSRFGDGTAVVFDLLHGRIFMVVFFYFNMALPGMTELSMRYQKLIQISQVPARSVLPYRLVMRIISI
jgi:hypothetical protein